MDLELTQSERDSILHMKSGERKLMEDCANRVIGRGDKVSRRIYEKWVRKNWYECGVSVRSGCLTKRGCEIAKRIDKAVSYELSLAPRGS